MTIDLHEKDDGTELVLTHTRFPTEESLRQHESGWGTTLDRLTALLGAVKHGADVQA